MKILKKGQYFGHSNFKKSFEGITITDTEYTHQRVDWHRHENPYFTFLLQGKLIEENHQESYYLSPGGLLFHNWQDAHRNLKHPGFTRGAHLEINQQWIAHAGINLSSIEGSLKVEHPKIKYLLTKVLLEAKLNDAYHQVSIELLVLDILSTLHRNLERRERKPPPWFKKLEEWIAENRDHKLTLQQVSAAIGIHPVHLSRTFHQYYGMTFGNYCRNIRLNRAVSLILSKKHSLTEVAYLNHYFDQSHMTASFKEKFQLSPRQLEKLLG